MTSLLRPASFSWLLTALFACDEGSPEAALAPMPSAEVSPAWAAAAQANIAAGEYAPRPEGDAILVTNRAQGLRGVLHAEGVTVATRDGADVLVELAAWGREGRVMAVDPVLPVVGACVATGAVDAAGACVRRVDYVRPGLDEWWENGATGLEQGFTVAAPPAGPGPLVFDIRVDGAAVTVDGSEALLTRPSGEALRYGGLAAWDERRVALPVWMEATAQGVRLRVDDSAAVGTVTVDPLLTTAGWTAEANQATASFGYAVSSAGDVNGDGYGDVLIGAFDYDNGQTDEGRAYLYLGAATGLSTTAAWTAESNQTGAEFGRSVSAAGDVNGDGYGDVIVGARLYDNGETDEGRVFVYLGGSGGLAAAAAWTVESNQANAHFGASVASGGDVNADGYADVVVGSPDFDNGEIDEGRAFVYHGSAVGLSTTAAWTAEADQASADFGVAVASAGDFTGDGYGDVLVGARYYDGGQTNEGRVFLYRGGSNGLAATPSWTAESDQANAYFGRSVASAGDVNGDGLADLVIGASGYDGGQVDEGKAFLYLGVNPLPPTTSAAWTAESDQADTFFGVSVASAGDVNGDGYGDVVVGGSHYDAGAVDEGRAYLYFGSTSGLSATAAWTQESDQASAYFGYSVSSAGDVNGDGFGDVVVGGYSYDNGQADEGRASVYLGAASGPATAAVWTDESNQADAWFGDAVASVGDVNGDGFGDVLVGAKYADNGEVNEGRAYLYLGNETGVSATAAWTGEGNFASAKFGSSVASAGDVNGDGYGDVVIGAPDARGNNLIGTGRAYVYSGSPAGLSTTAFWTVGPNSEQAVAPGFGASVASAGDVNGDGYGDVLVGAPRFDNGQTDEGRTFLYLGSSSGLVSTAAWTAESQEDDANFGVSLGSAGDVNGDGYGDVIVGADLALASDSGAAYVYLGSANGLAAMYAWSALGGQTDSTFGGSVGSAGDVNGDGFGDIVVGASGYTDGQTGEGRVSVFLGSAAGVLPAASWTKESNQANAALGCAVASAGDVNGDGFGDVLVGAYRYANGESAEGRTFVYLGSATGLATTAAWTAESNQVSAYFGMALSSAGDVNGDGYGDVIVGARQYDNGEADEGRAFIYLGNGADGSGPGRARVHQTQQVGGGAPVVAGLSSTTQGFDVSVLRARGAWGRSKVQVQVEAKVLGAPFTGAGLVTQPGYVSTVLSGVAIRQSVTGLPAATGYHWRARVRVSPAEGRPQGWGSWMYGGMSGAAASGHVFTRGTTYYADADGDGFGDPAVSAPLRGARDGYILDTTDCNDASYSIRPGGTERCDAGNVDEDCDGASDDLDLQGATGKTNWYADNDGDGYGAGLPSQACDQPVGRVASHNDCDDTLAAVRPGGAEVCDPANVDENCNGVADDNDPTATGQTAWFDDFDGDGFGGSPAGNLCDPYDNVANGTDCNDLFAPTHPGAVEECNGIDDNCVSGVDEGVTLTLYLDGDGDGYGGPMTTQGCAGTPGYLATSTDCDDGVFAVNPGAAEVCDVLNRDEDCDARADDLDLQGATGRTSWYLDGDADGYGAGVASQACDQPVGRSAASTDCNDSAATVNPGAAEVCDAANLDEDCDLRADDADIQGATGRTSWYRDGDGDGYGAGVATQSCDPLGGQVATNTDCNDAVTFVSPGAAEVCDAANVDEDCDAQADDLDPQGATGQASWYLDADADGYGAGAATQSCDQPVGRVATSTDCNDAAPAVHPGVTETCNGVDDNCAAGVDEGVSLTFYLDGDGDSYGGATTTQACAPSPGVVATSTDCDDGAPAVHPGAVESCNGVDDNCASGVDEGVKLTFYVDGDGDSYGGATTTLACAVSAGVVATSTDCDDAAPAVHPGALETCNGVDDNCVSGVDEGVKLTFYVDGDGDGYGGASSTQACTAPVGYVATSTDCDDGASGVHPGAVEVCNGVDDNCLSGVDEGVLLMFYRDGDSDAFGGTTTTQACTAPSGYVANSADCDDAVAAVHPGEVEVCNGLDDNCVAGVDEGVGQTFYWDGDGDDFGGATPTQACTAPPGYVANSTDCDDGAPGVHPGATEVCNGVDDNCAGGVDEGLAFTLYADEDRDGYGGTATQACALLAGYVEIGGDCDDDAPGVHPGVAETCNGVDDNCLSGVDEGVTLTFYLDEDGDAFGGTAETQACTAPVGYVATSTDCDDGAPAVHPGAVEICNGVDDDCLAGVDEGMSLTFYFDEDGDGYGGTSTTQACAAPHGYVATSTDCDDVLASVHPGAAELCNGVDDNCALGVDEAVGLTFYLDADADGYGGRATAQACTAPDGYVSTSTDCDDSLPSVHPGASELCNGVDDNCALGIDEGAGVTFYADLDGDGYGGRATVQACTAPDGYVTTSTDCDDGLRMVNPAVVELCNGRDDDCDVEVDEPEAADAAVWFEDGDGDLWGDDAANQVACARPAGFVATDGDCDDSDGAFHPSAPESCVDGIDYNCDGSVGAGDGDRDGAVACQDCDDDDGSVYPGADEVCNGVDDDCDGTADAGAMDRTVWYVDADGDLYGAGVLTVEACEAPLGMVAVSGDCDDRDGTRSPGAAEVACDGVDQDCDGVDAGVSCGVDTDLPDTDVADTDVADTDVPDTDVADTDVADTDVPDTDVADTDVADTDVPDTDVADTDAIADTDEPDTDVAETVVIDTDALGDTSDTGDTDATADTEEPDTDVAETVVTDTDDSDGPDDSVTTDTDGGETDVAETETDGAGPDVRDDVEPPGCGCTSSRSHANGLVWGILLWAVRRRGAAVARVGAGPAGPGRRIASSPSRSRMKPSGSSNRDWYL